MNDKLECPNCHKNNISVQVINETLSNTKHRSIIMWLLFWWWFELIMWLFLTIPRLLIAIFVPKSQKISNRQRKLGVCQDCGYSNNINEFSHKEVRITGLTHNGYVKYKLKVNYNEFIEVFNNILIGHGKIIPSIETNVIKVKIKPHLKPMINPMTMEFKIETENEYLLLTIQSKCHDGAIGINSINKMVNLLFKEIKEELIITEITKI